MTNTETARADLDRWTQTYDNTTADARISEEAERDVARRQARPRGVGGVCGGDRRGA